ASILSRIGGFFSFLSRVFVFLFGATKLAPWGFLQTYVFSYLCTEYQRKLLRKLKNKYEPILFISGRTKDVTLEERVQNMENMLKEYYINTDFLNLLVENNNKVNDKADNKV
ncbi:16099_t:CDS:2, partial [Rhizophagus irregularis]